MAVLSASLFTGAPEVVASLTSLPCLSNVQKGHALHWQRGQCAFALSAMQNLAHDAVFRSPGKVDEHGWPRIDGGAGAPPLGGCSFFAFGAGFGGAGSATFRQLEHARHLQYAQPASPAAAQKSLQSAVLLSPARPDAQVEPFFAGAQNGHARHWQRGQWSFDLASLQKPPHASTLRSPGKAEEHGVVPAADFDAAAQFCAIWRSTRRCSRRHAGIPATGGDGFVAAPRAAPSSSSAHAGHPPPPQPALFPIAGAGWRPCRRSKIE